MKNYTRGGVPNWNAIIQDWVHQSFISCIFYLLGQEYKFLLRNPRVLLALVQTLLICVFHLKSLVIVTPWYLMLSMFSRSVPSKIYEAWIFLIRFLVSCIILHLTGWNLIPHFLAQQPNRSISLWSFTVSSLISVISKESYFRLNIWWEMRRF